MRGWMVLLIAVALSGCLYSGAGTDETPADWNDPNGEDTSNSPQARFVESNQLDAGRHLLKSQIELDSNATVTATFTVESAIEYAVISLQNCQTRAGSGTGFVDGGNATHTESFAPGTLCVTVEARHDASFDYELEVTWVPTAQD